MERSWPHAEWALCSRTGDQSVDSPGVCEKRSNMAGSVRGGRGEARAALRGVPQGLGQGGCMHLAGTCGCCNAALLICVKQGLCSSGGQLPSTCCKDQRVCSGPHSLGRQQPKQEDDRDALDNPSPTQAHLKRCARTVI